MSDGQSQPIQAIGSVTDMVGRMHAVLPASWFPVPATPPLDSTTPVLDSVLSGIGQAWSFCYSLLSFVRQQTRLASLTGSFLDLYASDFFGPDVRRMAGETDPVFKQRIHASLLPGKATRGAVLDMLLSLTGSSQFVFEPSRAADTGGYGIFAAMYGSCNLPFQMLLSVGDGSATTTRESIATFLDQTGLMQIAGRHVLRTQPVAGNVKTPLIEGRGFNLIKDSLGWSGFAVAQAGGPVSWTTVSNDSAALLSGYPMLAISITGAGIIIGPSVPGPTTGPITASVWLQVPTGHQIGTLRLAVSDGFTSWYASVDLTLLDQWQRLAVTVDQPNGQVSVGLVGTSDGVTYTPLNTQCWQIEPGDVATSYIPSSFQTGFRDADSITNAAPSESTVAMPTTASIRNTVNRVIPAGSVAWLRS